MESGSLFIYLFDVDKKLNTRSVKYGVEIDLQTLYEAFRIH